MVFVIHWHESTMDLHAFPILIPPPTSLSTRFLWVFPVHQARALVSCIQLGLVICFSLHNIHVSMLFVCGLPPLFYTIGFMSFGNLSVSCSCHLENCIAHSTCSINVCWLNEWREQWEGRLASWTRAREGGHNKEFVLCSKVNEFKRGSTEVSQGLTRGQRRGGVGAATWNFLKSLFLVQSFIWIALHTGMQITLQNLGNSNVLISFSCF